jgi:hypothetical protein
MNHNPSATNKNFTAANISRKLRKITRGVTWRWITCTKQYFGELPIRKIDFAKPAERTSHDKIASLVEQMVSAQKQLAYAKTDKDKAFYGGKCESLDRQIDALVNELYGLTEAEIKIVEGQK